jgi:hypothetical protein
MVTTPQIPPLAGMAPLGLAPPPATEAVPLTDADRAKRRPPAGWDSLPLFDEVAKRQLDLFG